MNISSRCEYACRAMVELSKRSHEGRPVTGQVIAECRRIPEKYLVHILIQLKRSGLVRSVRGAQGGYMLAKASEEITLLDVVQAIDGTILDPLPVEDGAGEDLARAWKQVAVGIGEILSTVTMSELAKFGTEPGMYYI